MYSLYNGKSYRLDLPISEFTPMTTDQTESCWQQIREIISDVVITESIEIKSLDVVKKKGFIPNYTHIPSAEEHTLLVEKECQDVFDAVYPFSVMNRPLVSKVVTANNLLAAGNDPEYVFAVWIYAFTSEKCAELGWANFATGTSRQLRALARWYVLEHNGTAYPQGIRNFVPHTKKQPDINLMEITDDIVKLVLWVFQYHNNICESYKLFEFEYTSRAENNNHLISIMNQFWEEMLP